MIAIPETLILPNAEVCWFYEVHDGEEINGIRCLKVMADYDLRFLRAKYTRS